MAERERVRSLTETEYVIVKMLAHDSDRGRYGLELVKMSEGRLKRGTIYVLLGRLQDKGFVASRTVREGSAIPRRLYRLTGLGQQVHEAWRRLEKLGRSQKKAFA